MQYSIYLIYFIALLSSILHIVQTSSQSLLSFDLQQKYSNLIELIDNYKMHNNIDILKAENSNDFCNRNFVLVHSIESEGTLGVGNQIGRFLSGIILALALNRTIVYEGESLTVWHGYIEIKDWIPFLYEVKDIALRNNCNLRVKYSKLNLKSCNGFMVSKTTRMVATDGEGNILYNFLRPEFNPKFDQEQQYRSNILFPITFEDDSRFFSYGAVYQSSIQLHHDIRYLALYPLQASIADGDGIKIGIHLRHRDIDEKHSDFDLLDNQMKLALSAVRSQIQNHTRCIVYIATERQKSLYRLIQHARDINCYPFFVDRMHHKDKTEFMDHGIWGKGLLPLADLHLLSHSDYFIGTYESTYSILAANEVSLNSLKKGITESPLVWITTEEYRRRYVFFGNSTCLP